ncbi:MAG: hypothetical protein IT236_16540 [Bacteroidia bacterium]|nr:hypothetical protein [Bacteroidia bacterium]
MLFIRSAIIILLSSCCAFLFSQTPHYSREFAAIKSNVPLQILNNNADYFYVLRYNKSAHDFVVERRAKPDAGILSFTPLQLDSLNASWFDYENLEYSFFSSGNKVCFVFKKTLNNKKSVFIKEIDTLGKASGFKELASIESAANEESSDVFYYVNAQNKILLVSERKYYGLSVKKTVSLYDTEKNTTVWIKKLPLENQTKGFSSLFVCNDKNDLYYTLQTLVVYGYQRKTFNTIPTEVPQIGCDSLWLACLPAASESVIKARLNPKQLVRINSLSLFPVGNSILSVMLGNRKLNEDSEEVFISTQKFDANLKRQISGEHKSLSAELIEQLSFYDGSDDKEAAKKLYDRGESFQSNSSIYMLAGRQDENYCKEFLFWAMDPELAKVRSVKILPRKLFYFQHRTRFHNLNAVSFLHSKNGLSVFLIESSHNAALPPVPFNYHQFDAQKQASGGNLACYTLDENGVLSKTIIEKCLRYSFIPLKYTGNQPDFIYYLSGTKNERFAILQPNPF